MFNEKEWLEESKKKMQNTVNSNPHALFGIVGNAVIVPQKNEEPISKDDKQWKAYPDYYRSRKRIGKFIVELIAGKERGGMVRVWDVVTEKTYVGMYDETTYFKGEQIISVVRGDYMEHENAKSRYNSIKTVKDIGGFIKECC